MTNKIGIGVSATLDASGVEQGLNAMGQKIAQANRIKFNPVSVKSVEDVKKLNSALNELLKTQSGLRKRVQATGQQDKPFDEWDWERMYPQAVSRKVAMETAFKRVAGQGVFQSMPGAPTPAPPHHPSAPPPRPPGQTPGGIVTNTAQAGLSAMGPAGGVAARSLGTGMSAGFGAGLMGLVGGMLALGVGKIISGVMEKVDEATQNNVDLDTLKRSLGDVGVAFSGLKEIVNEGSKSMGLTFAEGGRLTQQFVRLGNVSGDQYQSLADEVGTGVGMSRSFGLDPSAGVGVLGQMRGLGITSNTQETRRFALLIGETIGKAGAFAKADEVMDSIASYAQAQTRASLGGANAAGYAGMFSSMVGSGIQGLDPSGASSLIMRMNAALSAGGAKGEASQFFSTIVGQRMGLDPLQSQVLREGGAFATNSGMFGGNSAYSRYMGKTGPEGDSTFLDETRRMVEQVYGGDSDQQKLLRAQAFGNHTGLNMNQAMAVLSLKPNQMGEMQRYGDLGGFNAGGIASLSKVLYGSDAERGSVADSLMARKDVTAKEKASIQTAMESGDADQQRDVLAAIVATRDQEETTGKTARDTKNAVENIKTTLADKMVPLMNEMRLGIMYLAGYDKGKTSSEVMKSMVTLDSQGREKAIKGRFSPEENKLLERQVELQNRQRVLSNTPALQHTYRDRPDVLAQKLKERDEVTRELGEVEKRLSEIQKERADLLAKENARRKREIEALDEADRERALQGISDEPAGPGGGLRYGLGVGGGGAGRGGGRTYSSGGGASLGKSDPARRDEAMKYFTSQGWTQEQAAGLVANLWAESGMREKIEGDGGKAYGIAQWHPDRQAEFKRVFGKDIRESTFQEQLQFVQHELTKGNERAAGDKLRAAKTPRDSGAIGSRYYERPRDADGEAAKRGELAEQIAAQTKRGGSKIEPAADERNYKPGAVTSTPLPAPVSPGGRAGTAMPPEIRRDEAERAAGGEFRVSAEPIIIRHETQAGLQYAPDQAISTRVQPMWPNRMR